MVTFQGKGGVPGMKEETALALEQENARLKADNEMLLNIITQMKLTLNRVIARYITSDQVSQA